MHNNLCTTIQFTFCFLWRSYIFRTKISRCFLVYHFEFLWSKSPKWPKTLSISLLTINFISIWKCVPLHVLFFIFKQIFLLDGFAKHSLQSFKNLIDLGENGDLCKMNMHQKRKISGFRFLYFYLSGKHKPQKSCLYLPIRVLLYKDCALFVHLCISKMYEVGCQLNS